MVEGPQTSNVESSGIVENYGNSVHTDPPVSACLSSIIVYPEGQTFLPYPDVQQVQYDDVPVSIVAVTGRPPGRTTSFNTEFFHPFPYILLW